jgi:glycerol-3-phosphate acyltransferase PlsY
MLSDVILILLGYLLGSVSSAVLVARAAGLPDPRTVGSRNPGATNVLRVGGKATAGVVLAGDMLKGTAAVLLTGLAGASPRVQGLAGLAAFLGHLYPIFFGFKGGKGVATYLGVLLGLAWIVAVLTMATWLAVAFLFRYSSLAAMTAAALAPGYMAIFGLWPDWATVSLVMSVLLLWRHRQNLHNLLAGCENRIGQRRGGNLTGHDELRRPGE